MGFRVTPPPPQSNFLPALSLDFRVPSDTALMSASCVSRECVVEVRTGFLLCSTVFLSPRSALDG